MRLLTTQEACEQLRCERRKLKRLAQTHGLSRTRIGRFYYYHPDEITKLIRKNTY